ncbi:APC family permease [Aminicella lysinilytica]|uniref:APC family permease n=1 Tax=Aminicella lysinilytica TaxID=433323 RepID=UPI0026ED2F41|nr:amino acid permease [Aminicella lysinilytica]
MSQDPTAQAAKVTATEDTTLQRSFGMKEAVTITVGNVIGVGLFTTGAQIVGTMGSSVIIATFIAMIISVYPAKLYGEMGAALPFAGGTYKYAQLGLGKPAGVLAGWNFIASLIAVTSGEALAFAFYFKTLFRAFGIELPVSDMVLASIPIILFIITNVRGTEMTGRLQNGFMFFFWGVAIIWFLTMIPNINMPSYVVLPAAMQSTSPWGFIGMVAMIWWCFAGFETCCAMGEEIKYPQINLPRALRLSPYIVFAVNAIFQWFLIGIVPADKIGMIATADAPFAVGMQAAGILGIPMALLAAGIAFGGDFSTLNSSIAVPPRYLFAMAREGSMPKFFAKLHPKYKTPYVAILVLGILSLVLTKYDIKFVAEVSLFADLFYYVIGIAAALGLRIRHPELNRPYKAPFIKAGVPVSIIIYVVMMTQLSTYALISGVIWCAIGLIIYYICRAKYGEMEDVKLNDVVLREEIPSPEEKTRMDKEYKLWGTIVLIACIIAITLYVIPFIF